MPVTHIIWDWNGTLLDDIDAGLASLNLMLNARSLPQVDLARYREVFNFPVKPCYEAFGFDTSPESWEQIKREFHDHYERLSKECRLRADAQSCLLQMKESAIPMSIASACEQSILDRMTLERGVTHFFQHTRGMTSLDGASKLHIVKGLIQEIGAPVAEVLLVGDTTHDHEIAGRAGCRCVLMTGGHQSQTRLESAGCPVISRLQELIPYAMNSKPNRTDGAI